MQHDTEEFIRDGEYSPEPRDNEENEDNADTETSKIIVPKKQFISVMQKKRDDFNRVFQESVDFEIDLKHEQKEASNYKNKTERLEREKRELEAKLTSLQNQVNIHQNKIKLTPNCKILLDRLEKSDEDLLKERRRLVEEGYERKYGKKLIK
jgi:hypothetical protein